MKDQDRRKKKETKRRKKTALIICHNGRRFWTSQSDFWQWVREKRVVKLDDYPLTGKFLRAGEESVVVLQNTVLNLACPNHLHEALTSRRLALSSKK